MAIKGDGSSGRISTAQANNLYPYSYHFFARKGTAPSTGTNSEPVSLTAGGVGNYLAAFAWDDGVSPQSFYNLTSGGTFQSLAIAGGTLSTNTWYGLGVSFTGTSAIAYKNGAQNNTATWGAPNTGVTPAINLLWVGYSPQFQYFDGMVAEVGIWNVVLTAGEFAALGLGVPPFLIRPQNLVFYAPCVNEAQNIWSPALISSSHSLPLTITGGVTFSAHPVVYGRTHVDLARRFRTPANLALSNNVNLAGLMQGNILGVDGWSNGVNLAGVWTVTQLLSNNVNFASLFSSGGLLQNNVNFQSVFKNVDAFSNLKNQVNFRSRFLGDVGAIASGRFREHFYGG